MKPTTLYIYICIVFGLLIYLVLTKTNDLKDLSRENEVLRLGVDSTSKKVKEVVSFSDSIEIENKRIQASKDSLQVYFNMIEEKLQKKEKEYEKLVNDTSDIYMLYRELTKHLFTY